MELVKYIADWYSEVPEQCKGFISQQMGHKFPGFPEPLRYYEVDAMPLIIKKMQEDGDMVSIGYVVSFIACMDYVLYDYADVDHFLEMIEMDKEMEAELIFRQSFESAGNVRQRIDNAPQELAARKQTADSWDLVKKEYLNLEYLKRFTAFQLQQSIKRMSQSMWRDITKNM